MRVVKLGLDAYLCRLEVRGEVFEASSCLLLGLSADISVDVEVSKALVDLFFLVTNQVKVLIVREVERPPTNVRKHNAAQFLRPFVLNEFVAVILGKDKCHSFVVNHVCNQHVLLVASPPAKLFLESRRIKLLQKFFRIKTCLRKFLNGVFFRLHSTRLYFIYPVGNRISWLDDRNGEQKDLLQRLTIVDNVRDACVSLVNTYKLVVFMCLNAFTA